MIDNPFNILHQRNVTSVGFLDLPSLPSYYFILGLRTLILNRANYKPKYLSPHHVKHDCNNCNTIHNRCRD